MSSSNGQNSDWNTASYGMAALEDRCAPREGLNIPISLRPAGALAFQTILLDLSISGFCANSLLPLEVGNRCWMSVPGMPALQAHVVWWDSGRVGCAFDKLISPIVHENIISRHPGRLRHR